MSTRDELLTTAYGLEIAHESMFLAATPPPAGVDPSHLRIIKDTNLRAKLLRAGLAEGIQSPKGSQAQRWPSIIRLYHNGDAPRLEAGRRLVKVATRSRLTEKPTIEQMETLIKRFRAVESHIARELALRIDDEVSGAQQAVATASPEELSAAVTVLQEAIGKRDNGTRYVREKAFAAMQNENMPERRFLSLLA